MNLTLDKQRPMRVLHLVNKWMQGGVERYIESLYACSDKEGTDFFVASVNTSINSKELKCETFGPIIQSHFLGKELLYASSIAHFISGCRADIVHIHTNNGTGFLYAHLAKKCRVNTIVLHSHNSNYGSNFRHAKAFATNRLRGMYSKDVDLELACSRLAGLHLFGDESFQIAKNGVCIEKFGYSARNRLKIRSKLGIPADAVVFGFVASLTQTKNIQKAISVFRHFHLFYENSYFIALGEGDQSAWLSEYAKSNQIEDYCRFEGFVSNPYIYYSAMDVLLAPSLYEGLPINLVEAQAAGCLVAMSDSITDEVQLVDTCHKLSLSLTDSEWTDAIRSYLSKFDDKSRTEYAAMVKAKGFDVVDSSAAVFKLYREYCK